MITCSAPGKVYLFGEHAVVYGQSAICCAIDLRTRVQATKHDSIVIESVLGTTALDFEIHPYVSSVIEKMKGHANIEGVRIQIRSELPVGSGLGSSAAVTVATLQALNQLYACNLQLEDIANIGHTIEREIQGNASPTDTYVSTMGGVVLIPERRKLKDLDCQLVIGNTRKSSSTKDLVSNVAQLRQEFPDIIDPILDNIGKMAHLAEEPVNRYDYETTGKLMNVNHGLLDAIGVGGAELSALVYAARNAGAISAKITGAGGGGCIVALANETSASAVASAIKNIGAEAILTRNTHEGVRLEP
ncbi:mevalonate kinase [Methanolobus halotolerans]|uniref:Mevalonate kinase n=1 Tax=Methanolobus halotolerans TaxID=2052935 RepID=A0A4E0Q0A2_9EURY|nr:mevalonate kinase [Methanolobus halotolerans]TGC11447.1 mevalonate kinase [Methanolobus halotolerans]